MKIYKSVEELVGNTPLLSMKRVCEHYNCKANIFSKLEFLNPAGSVKDRVALKMINDAESSGKITSGATIIEPTSGNTGIGIAAIGVLKGYNVIITMPDTMSKERIKLIEAYGAKVILTEGAKGMSGAIEKANEIANSTPNSIVLGQFINPSNPDAHFETTGPEIWKDTDGNVDILVSAVGTGGTLTGTGKYLKSMNPNIKVVAVEPYASSVLSGKKAGTHKIQGIGAGFIPDILDKSVIDEIVRITDQEAYEFGRNVAKLEGILVGISSGAAIAAAVKIAQKTENTGKNIVVILPDTGTRYLSTADYL